MSICVFEVFETPVVYRKVASKIKRKLHWLLRLCGGVKFVQNLVVLRKTVDLALCNYFENALPLLHFFGRGVLPVAKVSGPALIKKNKT
jgi:hypothetical protein